MYSKIATLVWFAKRPSFWSHAMALTLRKLLPNHDSPEKRAMARAWAADRAVPVAEALAFVGLKGEVPLLDPQIISEGEALAETSAVKMGGAGDLNLLYAATILTGATAVVETGVAYGWSSLAILAAFTNRNDARLISVDMPYPKMGNENYVGVVVPGRFRENWNLLREPDRYGLQKALTEIGRPLDLCHYDSDKSWWGRKYAYPLLWEALRTGGVFISDDIQDNMAFSQFVEGKQIPFAVTEFEGKFVGIARKN